MKKFPKISIITPSFNQASYLESTIISILSQGYPNLEYIIIDGGSTDGSVEVIHKYKGELAYWISEPDGGLYDAVQKGFNKSTGEIMSWLNSDDMYHPKSLFIIAEIFDEFKEVDWLTGLYTLFDEHDRTIGAGSVCSWSRIWHMLMAKDSQIQQESTFWRRTLWDKAGQYIRTDLQLAGDFELWHRFFKYTQLYTVTTIIGGFRFRQEKQKTLDSFREYLVEVDSILNDDNMNRLFKFRMVFCHYYYWFFLRFFRNFGFISLITINLFRFPNSIRFNRFTYRFEYFQMNYRLP